MEAQPFFFFFVIIQCAFVKTAKSPFFGNINVKQHAKSSLFHYFRTATIVTFQCVKIQQ